MSLMVRHRQIIPSSHVSPWSKAQRRKRSCCWIHKQIWSIVKSCRTKAVIILLSVQTRAILGQLANKGGDHWHPWSQTKDKFSKRGHLPVRITPVFDLTPQLMGRSHGCLWCTAALCVCVCVCVCTWVGGCLLSEGFSCAFDLSAAAPDFPSHFLS